MANSPPKAAIGARPDPAPGIGDDETPTVTAPRSGRVRAREEDQEERVMPGSPARQPLPATPEPAQVADLSKRAAEIIEQTVKERKDHEERMVKLEQQLEYVNKLVILQEPQSFTMHGQGGEQTPKRSALYACGIWLKSF